MSEISLKSAWAWANGEWGLGIFVPPEIDEKDIELMVQLQNRVPKNVKIWMSDTSKHFRPMFNSNGEVRNPSEVIAQCPTPGCGKRFRLTTKNLDAYCSKCGQALNWITLDAWKNYGEGKE